LTSPRQPRPSIPPVYWHFTPERFLFSPTTSAISVPSTDSAAPNFKAVPLPPALAPASTPTAAAARTGRGYLEHPHASAGPIPSARA